MGGQKITSVLKNRKMRTVKEAAAHAANEKRGHQPSLREKLCTNRAWGLRTV